jgi:signal transduction histidine kinase
MELELLNARKLESVGLLAGRIAHDSNNILTAIHGYSQLVQDHLSDAHQSSADLEKIKDAVGRAASCEGYFAPSFVVASLHRGLCLKEVFPLKP